MCVLSPFWKVISVNVCSPQSAWGVLAFSTLREALMGFEREKKESINVFLCFHSLLATLPDDPCSDLS